MTFLLCFVAVCVYGPLFCTWVKRKWTGQKPILDVEKAGTSAAAAIASLRPPSLALPPPTATFGDLQHRIMLHQQRVQEREMRETGNVFYVTGMLSSKGKAFFGHLVPGFSSDHNISGVSKLLSSWILRPSPLCHSLFCFPACFHSRQ
ncbi:hypothetical protein C8R43DRAFT_1234011, partial [Mycena crocata]